MVGPPRHSSHSLPPPAQRPASVVVLPQPAAPRAALERWSRVPRTVLSLQWWWARHCLRVMGGLISEGLTVFRPSSSQSCLRHKSSVRRIRIDGGLLPLLGKALSESDGCSYQREAYHLSTELFAGAHADGTVLFHASGTATQHLGLWWWVSWASLLFC